MTNTTNLTEVKKQMECDSVSGVLVDTYSRIRTGDLQESIAVVVLVMDSYGDVHVCKKEVEDGTALIMATTAEHTLVQGFIVDDDE